MGWIILIVGAIVVVIAALLWSEDLADALVDVIGTIVDAVTGNHD